MSAKRVASRYAKALVEVAQEQNNLEKVNDDIGAFLSAMNNRDFEMMVKSPIIKTDKKDKILDAIFWW